MQGDIPVFLDNKGQTWELALSMTLLVFVYVYRIDVNIERATYALLKLKKFALENIYFQVTTSPSNKVL